LGCHVLFNDHWTTGTMMWVIFSNLQGTSAFTPQQQSVTSEMWTLPHWWRKGCRCKMILMNNLQLMY